VPAVAGPDVLFFPTLGELREWARDGTAGRDEAWLGFHRIRYGADPAACVRFQVAADELAGAGWVPGERSAVDADRYAVRFAPGTVKRRKAAAAWTRGAVEPPELSAEYADRFRADAAAWAFFERQSPKYRRTATWWVMSGRAEATRERRITALIESSAAGERLAALQRQM
jgi:hypothetical protein